MEEATEGNLPKDVTPRVIAKKRHGF